MADFAGAHLGASPDYVALYLYKQLQDMKVHYDIVLVLASIINTVTVT